MGNGNKPLLVASPKGRIIYKIEATREDIPSANERMKINEEKRTTG